MKKPDELKMRALMTADYRILCADFRETLAACEGKAALIATSPPYPDARTCYEGLEWEDYQALGDAVMGALLPGGHCLLNIGAPVRQMREGHGTERNPLPYRLLLDWIDRVGLSSPDQLIYRRRGAPGMFPGFRCDFEPLFWFRKPGAPRRIFKERVRVARTSAPVRRKHAIIREADGSLRRRFMQDVEKWVDRGTVWHYTPGGKHPTGTDHPATWPLELASDIVACFSDVGDLVADPFLGGGTTLCAACDGDRRFIGGDLSADWAQKSEELARSRYAQLKIYG